MNQLMKSLFKSINEIITWHHQNIFCVLSKIVGEGIGSNARLNLIKDGFFFFFF